MDTREKQSPEVLGSEEIYRGRVFEIAVDTIREGDKTYTREIVRHSGGASVVAFFDDGTVALVRQYRHPTAGDVLELPAGKLESRESPEACAAREMEEELGIVSERLELLAEFFTTPGFCSEKIWVYLATGLTETATRYEDDEIIEIVRLPFERALEMIATGEIEDAKTIIGILLAAPRLGFGGAQTAGATV